MPLNIFLFSWHNAAPVPGLQEAPGRVCSCAPHCPVSTGGLGEGFRVRPQAPGLLCRLPPALACTPVSRGRAEPPACRNASQSHTRVHETGVSMKPREYSPRPLGCPRVPPAPSWAQRHLHAKPLNLTRPHEDLCIQLLSFSDFALRRVELMTWAGLLDIWGGSELVTHFCWAQISESCLKLGQKHLEAIFHSGALLGPRGRVTR